MFSNEGAEKVGITGSKLSGKGVPIRAIRSMVAVKKALAELIADFAGVMLVVMTKEIAGAPNVRYDILQFGDKVAEAPTCPRG